MRAQNQLIADGFDIFHGAATVLKHSIHIGVAFAVGLERVVMAVDEESGAR